MGENDIKLFVSRRTVLPDSIGPAILVVSNGKIEKIISCSNNNEINQALENYSNVECEDFGNLVLMPGIVDSHVHVNEPGRSDWEGFETATKAAAAGGVTTILDMPLNSIPPTTTLENLKIKAKVARTKAYVNVGFWGGVVPGNHKDLKSLVNAGVVGFKCFLCPSGVDEFCHVNEEDVKKALAELQNLNSVLAFHAECEVKDSSEEPNGDPYNFDTYLQTRPSIMEVEAIKMIANLCKIYKCRCHIVHLSASEALSLVREAKEMQLPLSAETCYHYLCLASEKVPRSATEYKCCPPIRTEDNRQKLWAALKDGTLDMVVSDHSPCTANLKGDGNFLTAWGGISSVQFGLSLLWTEISRERAEDFKLHDIVRMLCAAPAKLGGLENRKGALVAGYDADFVVWDPEQTFEIQQSGIFHKNKLTPYLGKKLFGKVHGTVVGGNFVYKNGEFSSKPLGQLLLQDQFLLDLEKA